MRMLGLGDLALPITRVGPGGPGDSFGSQPTDNVSRSEFVKVETEGDVRKPAEEMLPPEIDMSEEQEKRLVQYLLSEISAARMERYEFVANFARWKAKYRTKFPEFAKNWPIANSSQITIPIIRTAVHTLTSRVFQTVMAADPVISVRTKNEAYDDFVVGYEEFLNLYNTEKIDMEDMLDTVLTEAIKLGTAVVEVTTKKDRRAVMKYDPTTRQYKKVIKELYNGPCVYHFPIEDFWARVGFQNVQKMPWCGKEIRVSWSTIKDMALSGELNPDLIDKIWKLPENPGLVNEVLKVEQELEDREPYDWQEYSLFELSVRWDMDGDGIDEEVLLYFHEASRTILRKKFNTFRDSRRPWILFRYIRVEHRLYGEGMAEILEHLQEEISTIHNQRIDNATVANLQIILVKKLIRGLSPGDRLWSGKIVKADPEDVGTLRLGEIYPSTVTNENISKSYAQEISGIGDTATGQAQPVTRTTATATLSLLEELNRRFDKPIKSFRKSIREIGIHISDLFADYGTNGYAREWLGDERGAEVERYLADPATFGPGNASIILTSTKSSVNREVEFQSAIAVMNLVVQTGEQMLQLAQAFTQDPAALGELARALVDSIKGPWKKVIQYSDPQNTDEALAVLAVLQRILPAPEDMGGMAAAEANANAAAGGTDGASGGAGVRGNGTGPADDAAESRMAALLREAGRGDGRRVPVAAGRRSRR